MCGIALLLGTELGGDDRVRFAAMVEGIAPRGESLERSETPTALLATSRLKIVDRERAVQPWFDAEGRYALCYNGEVFNHNELRSELADAGRRFRSTSDTEVVLEALLEWGPDALGRFRGEFALALVDTHQSSVLVARDPAGIKPLYFVRHAAELALASEIKALVGQGGAIEEIPPGHWGIATATSAPRCTPYVDLLRLGEDQEEIDDPDEAAALVASTLRTAIARRVDTDLPVAVILSGGLDSSIVATEVARLHSDCVAVTVGAPGSEDLVYARRLSAELGIRHVAVEIEPRRLGRAQIREALRVAESTEYGDAINAVVSMEIFRAVAGEGVKVALVGDGADELFGGYAMYGDAEPATARRLFLHRIRMLSHTELQRVDRTSMGQCVEARVPFLDLDLLVASMRIPVELKIRDGVEKWILRRAFADTLPDYVLERRKSALSHSSGLHERIRLYKAMMPRWYRSFGYEARSPMQRDFSLELRRAGGDFDAAVTAASRHEDVSALERARDLAGALRWNVTNALHPGSSSRAGTAPRTTDP